MLRGTVNNSLYPSYVGFPGSVGTSVGVGNLDTKAYAFSANITFSHSVTPPKIFFRYSDIIADFASDCKYIF